jgi:orotidine-5'-phosphate decarboxylase
MSHNPLIIALDVDNAAQARDLIGKLGHSVDFYKIGMELYAAAGLEFVREVVGAGKQVFLDLKLYDIGETVKRAVAVVAPAGVRFLTVHGSSAVMRAAVEGRGDTGLQILAVTVLTSFDQQDIADLGYEMPLSDLVALRARRALACGMDGIVCSPLDAAAVRVIVGPKTILVTPGVRSKSAASGDQKRVATPAEAIAAGANYLVIGRQVTRAADPKAEVERIQEEIVARSSYEDGHELPATSYEPRATASVP